MSEDDWDKLSPSEVVAGEPGPIALSSPEGLEADPLLKVEIDVLAEELFKARTDYETAKQRLKNATEDLARYTPEAAGEMTINGNHWSVSVRRDERFEWDSEVLAALYSEKEDLPGHIKMRLSVDKKRYERLSPSDQADLAPALTIKLTPPKVEVKQHV